MQTKNYIPKNHYSTYSGALEWSEVGVARLGGMQTVGV